MFELLMKLRFEDGEVSMCEVSSPRVLAVVEAMIVVVMVTVTRPNEREVGCREVARVEGVRDDMAEVNISDDAVAAVFEGIGIGAANARIRTSVNQIEKLSCMLKLQVSQRSWMRMMPRGGVTERVTTARQAV
jgi:hypothetical protein